MKSLYQSILLLLLLSNSAISQAEINPQALLDLVTCYGADFPPEEFNKTDGKDPRLIRMEKTLASITQRQGLKPAEVPGFDQPDPPLQLLSFPIHFIGMEGYGPFSGINLSVGGNFKAVKDAVEQQQAIQYKHCKEKPSMHLQTCRPADLQTCRPADLQSRCHKPL